jgi:hypothetical protein
MKIKFEIFEEENGSFVHIEGKDTKLAIKRLVKHFNVSNGNYHKSEGPNDKGKKAKGFVQTPKITEHQIKLLLS